MAAADGDLEWISDYVVSIMKSPTWVTPIAQFIDDWCGIFVDTEENELRFTTCHNAFKQLVNDLLVAHLLEVSITPEEFDRFCERGLADNTRLHRVLVEQLLCVDDFLTFKAMMARQNADLHREAITLDNDAADEPSTPTRLVANRVVASSISEGVKNRDDEWQLYEDQVFKAVKESQNDQESLEAQLRCEEAELEQVIALSLQLEEERWRQLASQDEPTLPPPSPEPSAVYEPAPPPALPPALGSYSSPLCCRPPKLKLPPAPPRMVEVGPLEPPRPRGGVWGFVSAPLCPAPPRMPAEEAAPAPAPSIAIAPTLPGAAAVVPRVVLPNAAGFTSSPLCFRPPRPKISPEAAMAPYAVASTVESLPAGAAPLASVAELTAIAQVAAADQEVARVAQQQPTMELDGMRSNLLLWRARAERAITVRPPHRAALQRPPQGPQMGTLAVAAVAVPSAPPGPSEAERRQRAEHLARQRERLKQKRQREREQQLVDFRHSGGGGAGSAAAAAAAVDRASAPAGNTATGAAAAGRRIVAALSPGAQVAGPTAPPLPDAPGAAERMRQALTLQLRQTLVRTTVSDAHVLDGQLSQLESLKKSG